MDRFERVTVLKRANVYYDGKVTSRTVLFADGTRKTLGIMMPGDYEFETAEQETMEILGGSLEVRLPGVPEWTTFGPGQSFEVPARSKFALRVRQVADYCCSYDTGVRS